MVLEYTCLPSLNSVSTSLLSGSTNSSAGVGPTFTAVVLPVVVAWDVVVRSSGMLVTGLSTGFSLVVGVTDTTDAGLELSLDSWGRELIKVPTATPQTATRQTASAT